MNNLLLIDATKELSKFFNKQNTVLVIGALDGLTHDSLSPFVSTNNEWTTVFVEPVKEYYDKLVSNFPKRNNISFENSAITENDGQKTIYKINSESIQNNKVPDWCDGISTFYKTNDVFSSISEEHILTETVNTITVDSLVKKYNISNIDILQIDTEGYDYFILTQILDKGYKPKYIYIEIAHMTNNDLELLKNRLLNDNYRVYIDQNSTGNIAAIKKGGQPNRYLIDKKQRFAFFSETDWAFGTLHKQIVKELYVKGIDCDIIDWTISYSIETFDHFNKTYDGFITCLSGVDVLLRYGVPYSKIIGVAHGASDIVDCLYKDIDFNQLRKYAGISKDLRIFSKEKNISRDMTVLQNGIDFNHFYQPISNKLTTIGYCGILNRPFFFNDLKDWKRGYMVQTIAEITQTPLNICENRTHLAVPEFYRNVDMVINSSTEYEACGLSLMESAAAGRLPMSARVGIAKQFDDSPGIILPIEEKDFIESASRTINELKSDSTKFQKLCSNAQDFAREYYDWSYVIDDWANLITS